MTRIRTAALAAAFGAAAVLAPAAAHADSATVKDSTEDVWAYQWTEEDGETVEPAGTVANSDVKKSKIIHSGKRVEAVATYTKLNKKTPEAGFYAILKTPDGGPWQMSAYVWEGEVYGYLYESSHSRSDIARPAAPRGEQMCEGIKAHGDFKDDQLSVSVPRSCLGNPAWVKYHGVGASYQPGTETEPSTTYVDNAHNDTANHKGYTDKVKKG